MTTPDTAKAAEIVERLRRFVRGTEGNLTFMRESTAPLLIAAADFIEALSQRPTDTARAGYGILPLCWEEPHPSHRYPNWHAMVYPLRFHARIDTSKPLMFGKFPLSINGEMVGEKFEDVESAKAYAEARYRSIVQGLLATPSPVTDETALSGERLGTYCRKCGMAAPASLAKSECHRPDCLYRPLASTPQPAVAEGVELREQIAKRLDERAAVIDSTSNVSGAIGSYAARCLREEAAAIRQGQNEEGRS